MPQNLKLEEENDLQDLVDNQVPEGKTLDYKESLPSNPDSDKKEFLADVSSFANASGGYLIYGMRENNGIASDICGLGSINADAEIGRLENIIRDGIKPRIPGISMRAIPLRTLGIAIIIHIPMSWASPHMVAFRNDSKFFSRNSVGKYQLDVSELRAAFVLSETTAERVRNFRIDRLSKIVAGETPAILSQNPKIILHIVPFGAFNPASRFDVSSLARDTTGALHPISVEDRNRRHNFDGFLSFNSPLAYLQIFRNGIIEAVDANIIEKCDTRLTKPTIPSTFFETQLLEALPRFWSIQKQLGVEPPLFIMLSLLGVSGYILSVYQNRFDNCPIDRDALILPEIIVDNFDCNPDEVMRPIFDAVWNAAGFARSLNYDENKERIRQ